MNPTDVIDSPARPLGPALPRTYLYVPGNAMDKLDKALTLGAEALIVDLEDAVPGPDKDAARAAVVHWLLRLGQPAIQVWVRVNAGRRRIADIAALAGIDALTGIALAKAQSAAEVAMVDSHLTASGDGRTLLMPLLETATAVLDCRDIARQPRVHQVQIGEVDLAADLGISPGEDDAELAPMRAHVVLASVSAGINPPVGPVFRSVSDLEGLERSTRQVRRQGFFGRCCIHPAQIGVVHKVFTPTPEELADARAVLAVFEGASASNAGVALDGQGRMIDFAVVRNARRIQAAAARSGLLT